MSKDLRWYENLPEGKDLRWQGFRGQNLLGRGFRNQNLRCQGFRG